MCIVFAAHTECGLLVVVLDWLYFECSSSASEPPVDSISTCRDISDSCCFLVASGMDSMIEPF